MIIPFSKEPWEQTGVADALRCRYRMFKDFEKRFKIIGMTAEELISSLGKPRSQDQHWIQYHFGPEISSIPIKYTMLAFEIRNNKVISYHIFRR